MIKLTSDSSLRDTMKRGSTISHSINTEHNIASKAITIITS